MRPQQQNRRMRGRNNNGGGNNNNNNNNRKGPNPLTRNYESNGPDVKIRGSAQQIAEKYATLARDSQSAGDRVMAENYLQHAEHYNRIIAAAQAQMPIQQIQNNRDDVDDDSDQDRDDFDNFSNTPNNGGRQNDMPAQEPIAAPVTSNGSGPQPVIDGTPAEVALKAETPTENTGGRARGRRPRPVAEVAEVSEAPAPAEEAVKVTAEAEIATEEKEEVVAAPRRGRRPRRGERRPDEAASAAAGDAASASEPVASAAEVQDGDAALAAVNS